VMGWDAGCNVAVRNAVDMGMSMHGPGLMCRGSAFTTAMVPAVVAGGAVWVVNVAPLGALEAAAMVNVLVQGGESVNMGSASCCDCEGSCSNPQLLAGSARSDEVGDVIKDILGWSLSAIGAIDSGSCGSISTQRHWVVGLNVRVEGALMAFL
jgi:hypothetical protein